MKTIYKVLAIVFFLITAQMIYCKTRPNLSSDDKMEITGFTKLSNTTVPYGLVIESPEMANYLPKEVEAILNSEKKIMLPVTWSRGIFDGKNKPIEFYSSHTAGEYIIYGEFNLNSEKFKNISNSKGLKVTLVVTVKRYEGAHPKNIKLAPTSDVSKTPWDKGAGSPLVAGYFADIHMLIDNDTYYFYSSTDQYVKFFADNGPFGVWKSKDFVNWEFITFTYPDNFPSNDNWLWAPNVIKGPDSLFYMYYQRDVTGTHVAVSSSPEGPWKGVRNAGLNDNKDAIDTKASWNFKGMHDTDVFRDDDGKYYLIFNGPGQKGNASTLYIGELVTDPLSIDFMCGFMKEPSILMTKDKDGELSSEAASMFKKDGIYYLTYSEMGGEYYNATYRMSKNIYGPYGEDFHIVQPATDRQLRGPGHGKIFTNSDGNSFLLHHRQGYSQNIEPYNPVNESGRQVAIERLTFNGDGSIQEVIPSYDGVKNMYIAPKRNWEENLSAVYSVKATASENSAIASFAFDQNNVTQWVANSLAGKEQWLSVDLGSIKEINRTEVFMEFPTRYYEYRLQYSKDGKNWMNYADHSDSRDRNSPKRDQKQVLARYMKLFIGNIEGDPRKRNGVKLEDKVRACVFEFNIYGPGDAYYINNSKLGKALKQFDFVGTGWQHKIDEASYQSDVTVTSIVGDKVRLQFVGTQVKLYGTKANSVGKGEVYIDGEKQISLADFTTEGKQVSSALVYASPALSYGLHTIEVKCLEGTIAIDAAEAIDFGPADELLAIVDDRTISGDQYFTYTGSGWKAKDNDDAYNKTLHISANRSDVVEFSFTGSKVELYGQIGAGSKAYISIDGSNYEYFKARFDNSGIINQYKVYTTPALPFGKHSIKITTRGDQNVMIIDFAKVFKLANKVHSK